MKPVAHAPRSPSRGTRRCLALVVVSLLGVLAPPPVTSEASSSTARTSSALWSTSANTAIDAGPSVPAAQWVLVDAASGQVLAGFGADERVPTASTVKLLTALVVLDRFQPDDVVTIPSGISVGGASAGLVPGHPMTIEGLLAALLVQSGNDAAVALAKLTSGSVSAFVGRMQAVAEGLGVVGATIREPHGLRDRNRLSALDLATIARAALDEPTIRALVAQPFVQVDGRRWSTRNGLVGTYLGVTGLKTGHTSRSGWSLVASARRDDRHLIAVTIGAVSDAGRVQSARTLLDHGFNDFTVAPGPPLVRVRAGGGWLQVAASSPSILVASDARAVLEPAVPVELDAPPDLVLRWSDGQWRGATRLVDLPSATAAFAAATTVPGAASLGQWFADRLHAGMRAATVGGVWPELGER